MKSSTIATANKRALWANFTICLISNDQSTKFALVYLEIDNEKPVKLFVVVPRQIQLDS